MRRLMVAIAGAIAAASIFGVAFAGADSPAVTIEDASNVAYASALAKGTVDPKGKETYCHFEYVSQAQLEANLNNGGNEFDNAGGADCSGNPHQGTGMQSVEATLTDLAPATVYHLRLVASNEDGQSAATAANTFETEAVGKPSVTVDPVTTFAGTTAHFSGTIDPNASEADPAFHVNWHFECTPSCPGAEGPALGTGGTSQGVEADASGLEPNTAYEVRLVAASPGGTESAGPVSFKTLAVGPTVLTIPAFVLEGGTSALIGGRINAHNSATTWWVEYGTTESYGQSFPNAKDASAGTGGQLQFETEELTDLHLDTTYHFRVSAKNAQGEVHGDDLTFKTPPPPGPPVSCSNSQFRTGPSAALPDCRAYEDVTPLDLLGSKAYEIFPFVYPTLPSPSAVADSGDAILWGTNANLPGVDATGFRDIYRAKRTSGGWVSTLVSIPGRIASAGVSVLAWSTPDLERTIWYVRNPVNPEDPDPATFASLFMDLFRREPDGSIVWLTRGSAVAPRSEDAALVPAGASSDALKAIFVDDRQYAPDSPSGGAYIRSGESTEAIRDEGGNAITTFSPPVVSGVSADGSVISIQDGDYAYIYKQSLGHAVRISDIPLGSFYAGALVLSEDGSRFLFSTAKALTPDDQDEATDVYEYEVDTGAFTRLSGTSAGPGPGNGNAGAEPVLAKTDGSGAYFISTEQLDAGKGLSGAPNLYLAEGGEIRYALTLTAGLNRQRLTRDGEKLLFESSDRLTAYDNAGETEIYAYDQSDGTTVCVSCRPSGEVPAAGGNASFGQDVTRWNADQGGGRIFFESTDGLLPQDTNGKNDVYEYTTATGSLSLISTGQSQNASRYAGNGADGRDVFFYSVDSLTPNDRNVGVQKVFDARIGGGFAEPPPPALCEGEGCRGGGSAKPADLAPATEGFSGPGNPKPKAKKQTKGRKHKHKSHKKHQSKKSHKRAADSNGRTGR